MKIILYLLSILLLSLFAIFPSFNLALFGDDWLAFYRYNKLLGPFAQSQLNHLTYFLTPYGAQDILMGLLQKVYGYESTPYYLTSSVFRIIAAVSFYPLVYYLTKSKLAAFFAMLFFSITTIGLDTTNWVFNMPSYITIALFNLFLYFFLKSREDKRFRLLLISGLLYYLAYVITPIRMHGSLLFILLLEAFWVFQKRSLITVRMAAIRFSIILIVFLIIRFAGHSQGPPQEPMERFTIGLTTDLKMLSQGRFDFIFYPIVMFGSMIIPDLLLPSVQILSKSKLLSSILLPTFLLFLPISFLLFKNIYSDKLKLLKQILVTTTFWTFIVILIHQANMTTFNDSRYLYLLLIGGYVILTVIALLFKFFKDKKISTALFMGLSWSILSFFFAWWWVPTSIFPTTYRYLIVSAMGVSIILASIVAIGKDRQRKINLFLGFSLLLIVHIIATRMYLAQVLLSHDQETTQRIWSQIPHISEMGKQNRPIIFYFEGDGTNGGIVHDIITFGFPFHIALTYNFIEESKMPLTMDSWAEVVSAVKDGKSFIKHYGIAIDPIPIENVYVFKLEGRNNLINITDYARKELKRIKGS